MNKIHSIAILNIAEDIELSGTLIPTTVDRKWYKYFGKQYNFFLYI